MVPAVMVMSAYTCSTEFSPPIDQTSLRSLNFVLAMYQYPCCMHKPITPEGCKVDTSMSQPAYSLSMDPTLRAQCTSKRGNLALLW